MSLQEFLNSNPVDNLTDDVVVSPRFKGADGTVLTFKIKAMTSAEFNELQKACTTVRKGRKIEFDSQRFNLRSVINHTVVPDFKDAASIQKLGCRTPEEYVQKVLLAGEVATLANKISALSGFDVEMDELVEEAKN